MEHARPQAARIRSGGWWQRLALVALAGLVALVAVLGAGSPAAAHAELESSVPADGDQLATAPDTIAFTFGEDLLATGNAITLTGPDGSLVDLGTAEVDGDVLEVAWPDSWPAGEFTAAYRAVSADGHPIEGTVTFTVAAAGPEQAGTAAASPTPTTPQASPSVLPGEEPEPEASVLAWILGLGVVALIGALAATWVTRRRRG